MNKITQIFQAISDSELKEAIIQIQQDGEKGYIRENGMVRKYATECSKITNNTISTDLFMTEINLLREAAIRWSRI